MSEPKGRTRRVKKEEVVVDVAVVEVNAKGKPERFPHIKRMIGKLDRFLNRRVASIMVLWACAMVVLGSVAIVNGVSASASDGGSSWTSGTNAWLYSLVAVLSFFMLLALVRVIAIRLRLRRKGGE